MSPRKPRPDYLTLAMVSAALLGVISLAWPLAVAAFIRAVGP